MSLQRRPSREPPPAPGVTRVNSLESKQTIVHSIGVRKQNGVRPSTPRKLSHHEPTIPSHSVQLLEKTPTRAATSSIASTTPLPTPPPLVFQAGLEDDTGFAIPPPPPLEDYETSNQTNATLFRSKVCDEKESQKDTQQTYKAERNNTQVPAQVLSAMVREAKSILCDALNAKQHSNPMLEEQVLDIDNATQAGVELINLTKSIVNVLEDSRSQVTHLRCGIEEVTDSMARWRAREQIQRDRLAQESAIRQKLEREVFALRIEVDALNRGVARTNLEDSMSYPFNNCDIGSRSYGPGVKQDRPSTGASERMARILHAASTHSSDTERHIHVSRHGSVSVRSGSADDMEYSGLSSSIL